MINPNYNPFEGSWLKFGASLYQITCCLVSVPCWCMMAILASSLISCHIQPPFLYLAQIEEVVAQVATKWLNHCPPNL
jgi:hypothetical protein